MTLDIESIEYPEYAEILGSARSDRLCSFESLKLLFAY